MKDPPARWRRIIVVEDYDDASKSLARLLRLLGHEVVSVHTDSAVLAAAATFLPEIVIIDIGMLGMTAYFVPRRLRELPLQAATVLVALSTSSCDEEQRLAEKVGFNHYLVKPIVLTALTEFLAGLP
jgi:CheY-like chemotaxis protein